jgi:amidohydrolase
MDLEQAILNRMESIKQLRLSLHENAETAYNEYKTKGIIEDFLHKLNIDTKTLAKTGVCAVMNKGEKCIAIRADIDALPVNGVSHVCGHDYHMAVALGVCQILIDIGYKECVKFIFQPAEEADGGALPMINEGIMHNPKITNVIGYHVWPELPVGSIQVSPGASMASIDDFKITFKGKGGHAAMPHLCLNPIYPAIDFINAITIKSRIENNPLNPHVLTVASVSSGRVSNVIEDEAVVRGTVRTFDAVLRKKLGEDILNAAKTSSEKYNCKMEIHYDEQYPPLVSEKNFTLKFIKIAKELIGNENVLPLEKTFAGEDFAFFAEKVPSVHFRLGICDGEKGTYPLHSPKFDANDDALFYGIYVIVNFLLSAENK